MRRILCLLIAAVLCLSIAAPVLASEGEFVPSITYKPTPEIVPVVDEDGNEHIGTVIRDSNGDIIGYVDHGCLDITPIADVWDSMKDVPEDVERLLTFVYEELNSNEMEIPYEKFGADLNPDEMVIRDLFDARWTCDEHREMVEGDGVVFEITFDLGVVADAEIFVMTYDEEANEWSPIVKTVNNGDGTVTCTFEHLCAISFSMPITAAVAPTDDAPAAPNVMPWIIILLAAVAAVVVVVIGKNKKKTSAEL